MCIRDRHAVETVAHARAAAKYTPDATFLLDIGGQDMKAIWLDNGVITNIVVNEACSSGCGSFLENFASSLHIPAREIAEKAFSSQHPAEMCIRDRFGCAGTSGIVCDDGGIFAPVWSRIDERTAGTGTGTNRRVPHGGGGRAEV